MPISNAGIGHTFTVNSIDSTTDIDTFTNVIKRRERIVYRASLSPQSVNVAFLDTEDLSSENNLSITDRSTSLAANRVVEQSYNTISNSKTITVDSERFVVSDVFTEETETVAAQPLFYKHIIPDTFLPRDTSGDIQSTVSLVSIEILDSLYKPIKLTEKYVDTTKGIIYNNLASSYSKVDDYVLYYVKYVVNNNGTVTSHVELLDNVTTYSLATFDDLDSSLTILQDGRKVYLLEETATGFTITLPVEGTYAFEQLAKARIEILPPVPSTSGEEWFVRVTNGQFFTEINGTVYEYLISEFLSQTFQPTPPIKSVGSEESTIVTSNLIKLDHENINQDENASLYVSIQIYDSNSLGIAAFTTNPSLSGTTAPNGKTWTVWTNSTRLGIKSVDHVTGFIDLEGYKLKSTYTVESAYSYNEDYYEFTFIDFNPVANSSVLTTRTILFLIPNSPFINNSQTLYYLIIDKTGKVIESNWSGFDNTTQTVVLSGYPLYYRRFPAWKTTENHEVFATSYSVEGSGLYLILGEITVAPATRPASLKPIDTRKRGGGVFESSFEQAKLIQPEATWYWDEGYWDGTPYPGNSSFMIEVPIDVLENAGGTFTQQEVRKVVGKHMAAGTYPVMKAYGVDISVSGIYPGGNSIDLEWDSNDVGNTKFNIYYSPTPTGPWTLANPSPIDRDSVLNEYTVTGLNFSTQYYLTIVGGEVEDNEFLPHISQAIGPNNMGAGNVDIVTDEVFLTRTFLPGVTDLSDPLGHTFEVV